MKGLQRSLSRGNPQRQEIIRLDVPVNATVTVAGASGVGFGSAVLSGLPEGNIQLLGCLANLAFTGPTDDDLSDTWNGDVGLGTTPADDGTITAADVNIIASTALGPATAEAIATQRLANGTQALIDNTDGSGEVNLNLLVDDADIAADGIDITVTGTLHMAFIVLGDD